MVTDSSLGDSNRTTSPRAEERPLRLLTELQPWHRVFFENLRDTLLLRRPERVWTTAPPGKFWTDVFVPTGIPWGRLTESGVLHVLAVMMLVTFTRLYFSLEQQHRIQLRPPATTLRYEVSEYLPPINTGTVPSPKPRHGEPLLAKQKIVSLPPRPDNFEQTIISPVDVKLPTNLPLPNIVAWTAVPGPPSADALRRNELKLPPVNVAAPPDAAHLQHKLPNVAQDVIAPAEAAQLASNRRLDLNQNVIGPPPDDTAQLHTPREVIAITPAVMQPPAEANVSRVGAMNIGKMVPTVASPQLEVPEQRAMALPPGKPGQATGGRSAGRSDSPPPVPVQGAAVSGSAAGQLIALNLHPAEATVPVKVPPGRRSGEFAAGPEGKPNAPGTPEIKGPGTQPGTPSTTATNGLPPGIMVGQVPGAPPPGSVVVAGPGSTQNSAVTKSAPVLTASARPPRIGETPRNTTPDIPATPARIEERVFGGKRSYSMQLNMPNLNSAGGSWIIRFAQLGGDDKAGDITAPVATTKVDPAYPAQLMHDGVEGTVILYAVIRKDGTVADVRVLHGLEGHLDENARAALLRWRFRPGMKNGEAVDLEAVVQIPYKAPRMEY